MNISTNRIFSAASVQCFLSFAKITALVVIPFAIQFFYLKKRHHQDLERSLAAVKELNITENATASQKRRAAEDETIGEFVRGRATLEATIATLRDQNTAQVQQHRATLTDLQEQIGMVSSRNIHLEQTSKTLESELLAARKDLEKKHQEATQRERTLTEESTALQRRVETLEQECLNLSTRYRTLTQGDAFINIGEIPPTTPTSWSAALAGQFRRFLSAAAIVPPAPTPVNEEPA